MPGLWGVRAPEAPPTVADPFVYMMHSSMGGTFQEVRIDNRAIDKINGNTVSVRFINPPKEAEEWQGALRKEICICGSTPREELK